MLTGGRHAPGFSGLCLTVAAWAPTNWQTGTLVSRLELAPFALRKQSFESGTRWRHVSDVVDGRRAHS